MEEGDEQKNMILPNSALSWAATRSGLGFGDFLSSLTPEREQHILQIYNNWRASKGLKAVGAAEPVTPTTPSDITSRVENEDDAGEQDEMAAMMESIAEEIEEQEIAEAEELAQTLEEIDAIPVEEEIDVIEDEIAAEDDAVPADDIAAEDDAVPDDDIAAVEDDAIPDDDNPPVHIEEAEAEPSVTEGTPKETAAALSKLPKEPDEQIYHSLFSQFIDRADAIAAVKERIKYHTIRHRGTAGLRLFWQWLDPDAAADPLFVPLKGAANAVSEPSTPADEDVPTSAEPVTSTQTNEDASTPAESATPAAMPGPKEEHEVSLTTRLRQLPKEQDTALYEELIAAFPSVDEAVETVQGQIKAFRQRRKSTVALKAFLGWLEEKR